MRYRVSGDGWSEELEARRAGGSDEWRITDGDGREHRLEVRALEERSVLRLIYRGQTHTLTVLPGNRPGQPLRFLLDDVYVELDVRDEIDLLTEVLGSRGDAGEREELTSVMPGVIRKVLVAEGDAVEDGQPLFILEAMKMENEVRSPRAGTVQSLHVAEGQAVATGDLLAVLGSATP